MNTLATNFQLMPAYYNHSLYHCDLLAQPEISYEFTNNRQHFQLLSSLQMCSIEVIREISNDDYLRDIFCSSFFRNASIGKA